MVQNCDAKNSMHGLRLTFRTLSLLVSVLIVTPSSAQFAYECQRDNGTKFVSPNQCPQGMNWRRVRTDPYYRGSDPTQDGSNNQVPPSSKSVNSGTASQDSGNPNKSAASAAAYRKKLMAQAKKLALEHRGNGALILQAALCNLSKTIDSYDPSIRADEQAALLEDAAALAKELPTNGGLYMPAALGQCPPPRRALTCTSGAGGTAFCN